MHILDGPGRDTLVSAPVLQIQSQLHATRRSASEYADMCFLRSSAMGQRVKHRRTGLWFPDRRKGLAVAFCVKRSRLWLYDCHLSTGAARNRPHRFFHDLPGTAKVSL